MFQNRYAIIVAGGKGLRMGADLPKQFIELDGVPVIMHTLNVFYETDPDLQLILVLPEEQVDFWNQLINEHQFTIEHKIAYGGENRMDSVKNGLSLVKDEDALVAVHDGVRPLVTTSIIQNGFETAEKKGSAIVSVPLKDSIRKLANPGSVAVSREQFKLVQTPQVFRANILRSAFQNAGDEIFTDEASMVEQSGTRVTLVDGDYENIKITTPEDLVVAEAIIRHRKKK